MGFIKLSCTIIVPPCVISDGLNIPDFFYKDLPACEQNLRLFEYVTINLLPDMPILGSSNSAANK